MSLDQAHAFRDYVSQNEDVQKEIRSALMTESAKHLTCKPSSVRVEVLNEEEGSSCQQRRHFFL
jgi:hypothetical protein